MPRCRLRGVRAAVDRLDRHLLHQRGDMLAADLDALLPKQIAQHPAPGKRELHVQLVDPAHGGQVGGRHRPGQVIDAAPAHPQLPSLPDKWQPVQTVNHRFALGNSPAHFSGDRAERAGQKIVHQRQLANLGVQRLHIDRRLSRFGGAIQA